MFIILWEAARLSSKVALPFYTLVWHLNLEQKGRRCLSLGQSWPLPCQAFFSRLPTYYPNLKSSSSEFPFDLVRICFCCLQSRTTANWYRAWHIVGSQWIAAAQVLIVSSLKSQRDREREQGEASRLHVCGRETSAATKWERRGGESSKRPGHTDVILSLKSGKRPLSFDILVPSNINRGASRGACSLGREESSWGSLDVGLVILHSCEEQRRQRPPDRPHSLMWHVWNLP